MLRPIWSGIRSLLWRRPAVKREIDEELRFHLEQCTADGISAGLSPEEAAIEARKRFGNVQSIREDCREAKGASLGETMVQDIRFGLRMLRKNPGFTAVAALTLALGIGANTAMFGVLQPLLFPPLPYPDAGRLVRVYRTSPQSQTWSHSRADFVDHREQNRAFNPLAAYHWEGFNFGAPGQPAQRLTALHATAELFPLLAIQPVLGRAFTAEETQPGRDLVTLLAHSFWMSHFAGDTNIIGHTLRFDGESVVVIGVMPAAFDSSALFGRVTAWRPLVMTPEERGDRENRFLSVIGRLKPDVTLAHARAEMSMLAARLAEHYPQYDRGSGLRLVKLADSFVTSFQRGLTWFLFGLTSFVLLIACANLANLQLARNSRRSRELAVRAALGAGRYRLLRQLLTESLLISLLGGLLGLQFAVWCNAILAHNFALGFQVALDFHVLLFLLICCLFTVVAFGTVPAGLAVRGDPHDKLKEINRGQTRSPSQHRFQCGLMVAELALALMLLAGAGTLISGLQRFVGLDPGWRVDGLLTAGVAFPRNFSSPERRLALFAQLEENLTTLPGVQCASFTTDLPIMAYWNTQPLRISDRPVPPRDAAPVVSTPTVGPAYFQALGIGLRQGRFFTADDKLGRLLVTIINESMARQFWPAGDPLGKRISIGDLTNPQWMEIVGVVGDVRFPADADKPETGLHVYRPWAQDELSTGGTIVMRTVTASEALAAAMRGVVAETHPDLSIHSVRTVRQTIDGMLRANYLVGGLLGIFGVLGLLLAALGIYGVTSYSTAQRTGEIGIRMALGAQQRDVLWLVLRQGLRSGWLGGLLGLIGSYAMLRVLDALIPEGSPARDPVMWAGVPVSGWLMALSTTVVLVTVSLLACYLPAKRAARVDPMSALRCE